MCKQRRKYKEVLKRLEEGTKDEIDTDLDLYMLGLHLYLEHGLTDPDSFDGHKRFDILDVVSPQDIIKKEYTWMHGSTHSNRKEWILSIHSGYPF